MRRSDYRVMPWKNGLGATLEIARHPEGDDFDFDWRLSVAEVNSAGPFSRFPGYDRVITPLDGSLTLETYGRRAEVSRFQPHRFSGDDLTVGAPSGCDSVHDLNVMTDRRKARAVVDVFRAPPTHRLNLASGEVAFLFVTAGSALVGSLVAAANDTVVATGEESLTVTSENAQIVQTRIQPVV